MKIIKSLNGLWIMDIAFILNFSSHLKLLSNSKQVYFHNIPYISPCWKYLDVKITRLSLTGIALTRVIGVQS